MKIQVLSDLHIEYDDFAIDHSDADVVVLAGDINVGTKGVEWALNRIKNKPVIYVLGNHEYYNSAYPTLFHEAKALAAGTQVHVLENNTVDIGSTRFYGCTLWTNFELFGTAKSSYEACQEKVLDYRKITLSPHDSQISPRDTAKIHEESIHWLQAVYNNSSARNHVIVTHHAPSAHSVPERYKEAITSSSYASRLDNLINSLSPRLWIHGHMHESCDYNIGSTQVICNPKGYARENSFSFNPKHIVTI